MTTDAGDDAGDFMGAKAAFFCDGRVLVSGSSDTTTVTWQNGRGTSHIRPCGPLMNRGRENRFL